MLLSPEREKVMELPSAYIPMDRRQAIARHDNLPDRTTGAALFADISGFTPLTEALLKAYGPKRGPEELTRQLNLIYDALVAEVHRFGGSVIAFSGDAANLFEGSITYKGKCYSSYLRKHYWCFC